MSISISQTDNVGLTVESDPLALKLTGGTLSGKVNTVASTTANAGLSIPIGPAPTVPVDGDFWMSSVGPVVRLAGVTQNIPTAGLNNTFTGVNTFTSTLNYSGSNSNYGSATGASAIGISVGATTNGSTKAVNIGTNGLAGSTTNITVGSTTGTSTTTLQGITNGVTQTVNTNSTALATTGFVRDMLSDCTWSAHPISTCLSGTSGTGASIVNLAPDSNWLSSPATLTAGYAQKGMQMFARSNSSYGFNYTKEMRIACKMAISWSTTYQGITYTLIQRLGNAGNGALGVVGFGISIDMATKVLSILAHDGTTLTTKVTSWAVPFAGIASVDFMVKSDGTGTVSAYADGVLIDSTTGMSTATASANPSMFAAVEINQTTAQIAGGVTGYIANLRTFVAHG